MKVIYQVLYIYEYGCDRRLRYINVVLNCCGNIDQALTKNWELLFFFLEISYGYKISFRFFVGNKNDEKR